MANNNVPHARVGGTGLPFTDTAEDLLDEDTLTILFDCCEEYGGVAGDQGSLLAGGAPWHGLLGRGEDEDDNMAVLYTTATVTSKEPAAPALYPQFALQPSSATSSTLSGLQHNQTHYGHSEIPPRQFTSKDNHMHARQVSHALHPQTQGEQAQGALRCKCEDETCGSRSQAVERPVSAEETATSHVTAYMDAPARCGMTRGWDGHNTPLLQHPRHSFSSPTSNSLAAPASGSPPAGAFPAKCRSGCGQQRWHSVTHATSFATNSSAVTSGTDDCEGTEASTLNLCATFAPFSSSARRRSMPRRDDYEEDEDDAGKNSNVTDKSRRGDKRTKRARRILRLHNPDDVDLVVRAEQEDSPESKQEAYLAILTKAAMLSRQGASSVDAILHSFTDGNRRGRAIPQACEDLIKRAMESVRQRSKPLPPPGAPEHTAIESGKFQCTSCPKQYDTLQGVRLHVRNHHLMEKLWHCFAEGCENVSFVRLTDLRIHVIRVHSPTSPFPCKVPSCRQKLPRYSGLRSHITQAHAGLVACISEIAGLANDDEDGMDNGQSCDEAESEEYITLPSLRSAAGAAASTTKESTGRTYVGPEPASSASTSTWTPLAHFGSSGSPTPPLTVHSRTSSPRNSAACSGSGGSVTLPMETSAYRRSSTQSTECAWPMTSSHCLAASAPGDCNSYAGAHQSKPVTQVEQQEYGRSLGSAGSWVDGASTASSVRGHALGTL